MSRERNAKEIDAEPAADFEIDHRKRDRNSEPAIDHIVKKRISRVFEILRVALETLQLEQEMRKQLDLLDGVLAGANYRLSFARQRSELVEVRVDIEVGVFFLRDQQRAAGQGHRLPGRNHRKFASRVVHGLDTYSINVPLSTSVHLRRGFDKRRQSVGFERRDRLSANGGIGGALARAVQCLARARTPHLT